MNWSRTKLLFIITFLILDLFLATQLYLKHQNAEQVQSLPNGPSIKERLKDNNIQLPDLPDTQKATYIKGEPVSFKNQDGHLRAAVKKFEGHHKGKKNKQKISVSKKGNTLTSKFRKAKDLPDSREDWDDFLDDFLNNDIYKGSNYQECKESPLGDGLICAQGYQDAPVFSKNRSRTGPLRLVTKEGKITGFHQTLYKFKKYGKEKDLKKPIDAIYKISKDYDLGYGDKVKEVEFSYSNLTQEENGEVKTFTPTWYVRVDGGKDDPDDMYFVNAFNGFVQKLDEDKEDTDSE